MPTVTVPSATFPLLLSTPTASSVPAGGTTGGYQLIVVDNTGQRYAFGELVNAMPESYSEFLDTPGSASFTIPTLDAHAIAAIVGLERELQIWRNGRLQWWGPMVRLEGNAKRVDVQCRSLEWYFDRLFFGRADRTNYLSNPSFETGDLTDWTAVNTTAIATTSRFIEGGWSARLEQSTALQDAYLSQTRTSFTATGVGTNVTLAGYYLIDPDAWVGEAIGFRGAALRRLDTVTGDPLGPPAVWDIDGAEASGARGSWIRFEIMVAVPPDAVEDLEVQLYSPGGVIFWDALTLTIPESVSSVSSATDFTCDLATLFDLIVAHAQDAAFDKPALNIGVDAPLTGIRVERHYQLAEHANIGQSLTEFSHEGLAEWYVAITPTARTATLRAPTRGSRKPEFRVFLHGTVSEGTTSANIADTFRYSFDGEQAANSVVVLGPGDGSDREEGGAIDTSLFGGQVFEEVISAPAEANINSLDNLAAEGLAALSQPEIVRVQYLPNQRPGQAGYLVSRDPIDSLHVGDTVPVWIDYGWLQINDDFRVVAKEVDMQRDLATFTLNRVPA